jgi:hypothetical protein
VASDNPLPVARFPRDQFVEWFGREYKAGQHVSTLGSTGNGKTYLNLQLLGATAREELPAVVLAMKPKDDTIEKFRKTCGFRKVTTWPPPYSMWKPQHPPGWVLAPRHTFNPDVDEDEHARIFHRAILDSYKRGKRILFADEAYSLDDELDLGRYLVTVWTKGRSNGCGLWAATQKPTHVPLWMYSQASHLFLSFDPDKRARDRYREISGADPDVIARTLWELDEFEWLYVRPNGRRTQMCIVGA